MRDPARRVRVIVIVRQGMTDSQPKRRMFRTRCDPQTNCKRITCTRSGRGYSPRPSVGRATETSEQGGMWGLGINETLRVGFRVFAFVQSDWGEEARGLTLQMWFPMHRPAMSPHRAKSWATINKVWMVGLESTVGRSL